MGAYAHLTIRKHVWVRHLLNPRRSKLTFDVYELNTRSNLELTTGSVQIFSWGIDAKVPLPKATFSKIKGHPTSTFQNYKLEL